MKLKEKTRKIIQKRKTADSAANIKKRLEKLSEKINTSWKSKKTALELLNEGRR